MNRKDQEGEKNRPDNSLWAGIGSRAGCSGWIVALAILLLAAPLYLSFVSRSANAGDRISYSEFRDQVASGNVSEVVITGERVEGEFDQPLVETLASGETIQQPRFVTYLPSFDDQSLFPLLEENGVTIQTQPENNVSWLSVMLSLLPVVALLFFGYMLFRRARVPGGGGTGDIMSMTKNRARRYEVSAERTTFKDVAGADGAKLELQEIIQFLKDPSRFHKLGAKIPRGVLLVGPPGTGKTMLARAVAGEAGVPFFSISGSDFMEMFVGVGASRVRNLFEDAKKNAPAIIFIDELDSIGRKRGAGLGGGHDEREQTLNQLLTEMDGFEPHEDVILMAATNRPDILDPAILRPGRFDRQITVDMPTLPERLEILKIHARNKPISKEVDLYKIARGTPGFSGADLANLLNESALMAARRDKNEIDLRDVEDARDKVMMGLERNMSLTEEESRLVAYHEAGHALVGAILPHTDPVHKVTIVPRGRALGVTQQFPERDQYLYPREHMLDRMAVMMGGRAAEEIALNVLTSGASNDLKQATHLARKMILEWGMSKRLGPVSLSDENQEVFLGDEIGRSRSFSEQTAREADEEVRAVLEEAYERAKQTLQEQRAGLDRVVEELIAKEQVSGDELLTLLGLKPKPQPRLYQPAEMPPEVAPRPAINAG
jgi:cell division protease FtsH